MLCGAGVGAGFSCVAGIFVAEATKADVGRVCEVIGVGEVVAEAASSGAAVVEGGREGRVGVWIIV